MAKRRSNKPFVSFAYDVEYKYDVEYPTYRELCKNIFKHVADSSSGRVMVTRTRRGEWGQWFEIWDNTGIIKEGWM